jgi:hypothetical protein
LREQKYHRWGGDQDDVLTAKKNKGKSDGNKKETKKIKKKADASSWRDKIDEMVKSMEHLVNKTLEANVVMRWGRKSKWSKRGANYSEKKMRTRPRLP